jgi:hypothetical protein
MNTEIYCIYTGGLELNEMGLPHEGATKKIIDEALDIEEPYLLK